MKKTLAIAAVFAALALLGARVLRSQAPDPLDPLRVAPDTHKLAFENAFVRVLDVHVPPGKTEPRHRHPHGLSVYFTDWDVRVTIDGAKPETRSAQGRHLRVERRHRPHDRERRPDGRTCPAHRAQAVASRGRAGAP